MEEAGWLAVHLPSHGGGGWLAGWLVVHEPATVVLAGWLAGRPPTLPRWCCLAGWLAVHLPSHGGSGWLVGWPSTYPPTVVVGGWLAGRPPASQLANPEFPRSSFLGCLMFWGVF